MWGVPASLSGLTNHIASKTAPGKQPIGGQVLYPTDRPTQCHWARTVKQSIDMGFWLLWFTQHCYDNRLLSYKSFISPRLKYHENSFCFNYRTTTCRDSLANVVCAKFRRNMIIIYKVKITYRKTSKIRRTFVGSKIVDHSDVVGASPVGAAPTTSSFST